MSNAIESAAPNSLAKGAAPVKRGRGRPPGSKNKEPRKVVKMPPSVREAIKREFVDGYRSAVADSAIANARLRGLREVIRNRLGRAGLAEVEAEFVQSADARENEAAPMAEVVS